MTSIQKTVRLISLLLVIVVAAGSHLPVRASERGDKYIVTDRAFENVLLKILRVKDRDTLTDEDYIALGKLDMLYVQNADVKSIEGIQNCKILKSLYFYKAGDLDLSPLSQMETLETIEITDSEISNLTPILKLPNLKYLSLNDCAFRDYEKLDQIKTLEYILIDGDYPVDISELTSLTHLKGLSLLWEGVHNIDLENPDPEMEFVELGLKPLTEFKELEVLWLEYPSYKNRETINRLTGLKGLEYTDLLATDINHISNLTDLVHISLAVPNVTNLEPLANMKKLEWLVISQHSVSDLTPIMELPNLKELDFSTEGENFEKLERQLQELGNKENSIRRNIGNRTTLTLRALGSCELAYQDQTKDRVYGTWEELVNSNYIQEGYNKENIIDNYIIVVFDVTPKEVDEEGNVIKKPGFTIIAVPDDMSREFVRIYGIDERQTPMVWKGDIKDWSPDKCDLKNEDLWVSAHKTY